ncbi:MAG: hypothetical protein VB090_07675, partial [Petrimonas sp.]|nr:hypothetical protein [Petrimonas sp.]
MKIQINPGYLSQIKGRRIQKYFLKAKISLLSSFVRNLNGFYKTVHKKFKTVSELNRTICLNFARFVERVNRKKHCFA